MPALLKKNDRVMVYRPWKEPNKEEPGTITRTSLPTICVRLDSGLLINIHHSKVRLMSPLERMADI